MSIKIISRSLLAGLALASSLAVASPSAYAADHPGHKNCIIVAGVKVCFKL